MAGVLAASAGCGNKSEDTTTSPTVSTVLSPTAAPADSPPAGVVASASTASSPKGSPAAPSWPTPEDCVSYNPANVTVNYAAGIYQINDGSKVVMRLHGGPGETVGAQGLALAQRFRKHCYLGRNNSREDKNAYIFDYWRDASGKTPAIPDEEDACSNYDRNNLTVEDMGGGQGWRVKEHDHVLHVFDNGADARNGKLVAAKYGHICFIGRSNDDDQDQVSYFR